MVSLLALALWMAAFLLLSFTLLPPSTFLGPLCRAFFDVGASDIAAGSWGAASDDPKCASLPWLAAGERSLQREWLYRTSLPGGV